MSEADKYEVLEKIGHGSFGVIRKVRRKADGKVLCRKEISYLKMSQKEREQLHAEFQILSTLRHPNIVGYYHRDHLKQSQDLHLYMEYCGNGDLGRVIRELAQKNQYAEESFVWSIFAQLVTALYRCHYGVDPPPVGKNVLGLGNAEKPKIPPGTMTILHRDLKPENVFLGEDNSVKLGDFGLSKMIQSHDFASTYVGTPFYMSPEICAAEKYTLKSDIWSLGCIMFELCTREPPFNAKSHFQLVQKIKEGRVGPLPSIYSAELASVIKDCLKVNPDRRPDTAFLLNLPIIRLIRKERELLELSKSLQAREEALERKVAEVEQKMASVAVDRQQMRHEIDASLRREWEVKARLEIDRRVNAEIEQLQKRFEDEVKARVEAELQKRTVTFASSEGQELSSSTSKSDYPHSSIGGTSVDGDFPSVTDLTELSVDSPETTSSAVGALKKATRTPFGRAQTMFAVANTPMDVEMASPSPIAIASLSLSPRRNAATKAPAANPPNIFSTSNGSDKQWNAACDARLPVGESDSEEDDVVMPSPTRLIKAATTKASAKNPFTSKRPVIQSQKPTSIQPALGRLRSQPSLQVQAKSAQAVPPMSPNPDLHGAGRGGPAAAAPRERGTSPSRRLSKIPSAAALADMSGQQQQQQAMQPGQLSRKPSMTRKDLSTGSDSGPGGRANATTPTGDAGRPAGTAGAAAGTTAATAATKNVNIVRGRTLVELSQARAGGRPLPPPSQAQDALSSSPKRQPFRERVLTAAAATENRHPGEGLPPPVWDPERDEMPSPFLVRKKQPSGATKA